MSKMSDLMIDKMNDDYQKELEAIAELGYQAFLDGKRSSECPYKVVPLKHAWEEGYMDAEMCHEPFNTEEVNFFEIDCRDEFRDLTDYQEEDMVIC